MSRMMKFPGTVAREHVPGKRHTMFVMSDEQKAWLTRYYPATENERLMKATGLKKETLRRLAKEMGLEKSDEGLYKIRKRLAARIKKKCEKNGYYDKLRKNGPLEACQEGHRRMWQDIHEGRRENPMVALKRTNPKRYHKWAKSISDSHKEMFRKEKMRSVYGLGQKTRLRIVLCPFTRSQNSHRYHALQRGYILMEDCSEQGGERYNIYYDGQTHRTEKFEQNLINDGFKVMEWKD